MSVNLSPNQLLRDEHYLVLNKEVRQTKNGDNFLILELSNQAGKIEAKIWGNNIPQCQVEVGKVIEVNGKTQEYNGKISLIIDSCQIVNNEEIDSYKDKTPTLVFDIETIGKKFEDLDTSEQEYLLENLEKNTEDKEDAKKRTALHPIFGMVCAIGGFDINTKTGFVLSLSSKKDLVPEKENFSYQMFDDEKSLLEEFWIKCKSFEQFVTYNGENFDFPFLMIRSGINRIKIPFEANKRWSEKFIDLQNKLRQNNRAYKLEFLCKAFGIKNPKGEGVHGDQVSELYNAGEFNKIADYVSRDAVATAELYLIWKEFMSGEI